MKKVIVTAIVIALASAAFWFSTQTNNDAVGEVQIIVKNELGETVINDVHSFEEEDTLFGILRQNYIIGCADSSYNLSNKCEEQLSGRIILKIDDVETDWDNYFIAIYVNEVYSQYGIDSISLHDGDLYEFKYTEVGDYGAN